MSVSLWAMGGCGGGCGSECYGGTSPTPTGRQLTDTVSKALHACLHRTQHFHRRNCMLTHPPSHPCAPHLHCRLDLICGCGVLVVTPDSKVWSGNEWLAASRPDYACGGSQSSTDASTEGVGDNIGDTEGDDIGGIEGAGDPIVDTADAGDTTSSTPNGTSSQPIASDSLGGIAAAAGTAGTVSLMGTVPCSNGMLAVSKEEADGAYDAWLRERLADPSACLLPSASSTTLEAWNGACACLTSASGEMALLADAEAQCPSCFPSMYTSLMSSGCLGALTTSTYTEAAAVTVQAALAVAPTEQEAAFVSQFLRPFGERMKEVFDRCNIEYAVPV